MNDRIKILERLRNSEISADEAEKLLSELGSPSIIEPDQDDDRLIIAPRGEDAGMTYDESLPKFDNLWQWITGVGAAVFLLFGLLVTSITGFFAVLCFGPFVLAGFGIAALGLWSRSSHWIHVRVREKDGDNISISLPLPLGFAGWIMRVVQPMVKMRTGDVDLSRLDIASLIEAMGEELSAENPILVAVDDDDDQVLVYIT
ncbi:MAG: DUF2089 domain-containing protein [Chloroflexi bacterium]|nr:DUF2089 domain-containing protein [Chloroflexota bacterium]